VKRNEYFHCKFWVLSAAVIVKECRNSMYCVGGSGYGESFCCCYSYTGVSTESTECIVGITDYTIETQITDTAGEFKFCSL
jgi:hypothetical protein